MIIAVCYNTSFHLASKKNPIFNMIYIKILEYPLIQYKSGATLLMEHIDLDIKLKLDK